jgi:hypothetical protein
MAGILPLDRGLEPGPLGRADVEVLAPDELRQTLARKAAETAALYTITLGGGSTRRPGTL